jgi:hypothetical protein
MISTRREQPPSPGKNAAAWLTPGRFAALLGLLILVCFFRVVAGWETFAFGDYTAFGYPLAFYQRECFWRGELPFWNPYNNCGLPFLAQWNTLALYPLSLFYLLFPLSWSLGMFCLGHLFLAGLGMYFLAHRWTGSRLGAALAGVVFAFNGLTWHALLSPNNIAALGWMPWVVWTVEKAWRQGGRAVIAAALAGMMQMLAGAPEIILQTWLVVGALWVLEFFRGEISRWRMLGRATGLGSLVAGLAAAQLLPFLDLLAHSQRDVSYGGADWDWAMPRTGWANYLVPLFHCATYHGMGVFTQIDQNWSSSYFLGAGVIGLALLALWQVRKARAWLLGGLALLSLNLALGGHGWAYGALKEIVPQVGFMRYPIKFIILATFAFPLLAAYGLGWLEAVPAETWARERKRTFGLALGLLAAMAVILWFAYKYPLPTDNFAVTVKNTCARALFMVLMFGCLALLRQKAELKTQCWLQVGLISLLWFDVFTHAPDTTPTATPTVYEPDAIREFFKWDGQLRPGVSRAMQSKASFRKMIYDSTGSLEQDINGRRLAMFLDCNILDHACKLDGFYSLNVKEFGMVLKAVYSPRNPMSKLRDFLGVAYITNPTNVVDWIPRNSFLPLVTAGQKPVFVTDTNIFNSLGDGFEPEHTVYLPLEARGQIHTTNQASAKILSPPQFLSPQRLRVKVEAGAPAMVVVAQAFYHPWHAYVDGARAPLWRANYAFQALEVPAGRHEVNLVYEDQNFNYGLVLSLASLFICGARWFYCGKPGAEKPRPSTHKLEPPARSGSGAGTLNP